MTVEELIEKLQRIENKKSCDEDNQTANIYTWVSVVVWDDDN